VLVAAVQSGSPAEKAGVQAGDVILKMDGEKIQGAVELRNWIALQEAGSSARFDVFREEKEISLTAVLERMPRDEAAPPAARSEETEKVTETLGFKVAPLTEDLVSRYRVPSGTQGVLVVEVDPHRSAYAAGVRPGDVIQSVNKKPVQNLDQFLVLAKRLQKNQTVLLRLKRQAGTLFVAFRLRA